MLIFHASDDSIIPAYNWLPGQPEPGKECASYDASDQWSATDCQERHSFICQLGMLLTLVKREISNLYYERIVLTKKSTSRAIDKMVVSLHVAVFNRL